jgi:hypothetical protein
MQIAKNLIVVALGVLASLNLQAQTSIPTASVVVDGVGYEIPLFPSDTGKLTYSFDGVTIGSESSGFLIRFNDRGNLMDPDPLIAYGIAVTDFGAPSAFGFLFGTPIVPTGPGTLVSSSLAGSLTDGGSDGVTITPTGATLQTSDVGFPLTSMGVGIGLTESGIAGGSDVYGAYSAGPIAGPPGGPWTFMTVSVGFTLTGGGDVAALNGRAEITTASAPVPDSGPGLIGLAALGLVLLRARFRKTGTCG